MGQVYLRKTEAGHLAPASAEAEEQISKIKDDTIVKAYISQPRHLPHHRMFFALMDVAYHNQEKYESAEELLQWVKIFTGHCRVFVHPDRQGVSYTPKSISFASMDQTQFDVFFETAVSVICKQIIPGLDKESLVEEVLKIVNGEKL
jgi:hypothetical protein